MPAAGRRRSQQRGRRVVGRPCPEQPGLAGARGLHAAIRGVSQHLGRNRGVHDLHVGQRRPLFQPRSDRLVRFRGDSVREREHPYAVRTGQRRSRRQFDHRHRESRRLGGADLRVPDCRVRSRQLGRAVLGSAADGCERGPSADLRIPAARARRRRRRVRRDLQQLRRSPHRRHRRRIFGLCARGFLGRGGQRRVAGDRVHHPGRDADPGARPLPRRQLDRLLARLVPGRRRHDRDRQLHLRGRHPRQRRHRALQDRGSGELHAREPARRGRLRR